jgi:hypothetical protein
MKRSWPEFDEIHKADDADQPHEFFRGCTIGEPPDIVGVLVTTEQVVIPRAAYKEARLAIAQNEKLREMLAALGERYHGDAGCTAPRPALTKCCACSTQAWLAEHPA